MAIKDWDLRESEEYNIGIEMSCKHEFEFEFWGIKYCSLCGKMVKDVKK